MSLTVWSELYEASHVSHMAGLDADLSYITTDPRYHFSRAVSRIDPQSTQTWLTTLYDAAADLALNIEYIFVDKKVIRHLQEAISPEDSEHPIWKLIRPASGHDSHLHLRLGRSRG